MTHLVICTEDNISLAGNAFLFLFLCIRVIIIQVRIYLLSFALLG